MESLIDLQRLTGDYLWDLGVNIIVALMILVLGRLAANAISGLTRRLLQRSGLGRSWLISPPPSPMPCSLLLSSLQPLTGSASTQHR